MFDIEPCACGSRDRYIRVVENGKATSYCKPCWKRHEGGAPHGAEAILNPEQILSDDPLCDICMTRRMKRRDGMPFIEHKINCPCARAIGATPR